MGGSWNRMSGLAPTLWVAWLPCLLLLAGTGCKSSPDELDLAVNIELYKSPGYQAKVAVDRAAFVAPMVDQRKPPVVEATGPYPVSMMPDAYWARPLPQMVEDVLVKELEEGALFDGIVRTPPPGDQVLIVKPYLLDANCGQEEYPSGRRSVAEIAVRVVIYGPQGSSPSRPVVFDEIYRQPAGTDIQIHPLRPPQIFGIALQQLMTQIVPAIDQSNVARSGVPLDSVTAPDGTEPEPAPEPASAERRR